MTVRLLLAVMLLGLPFASAADDTALPGTSLYHLDIVLTDQDGQDFALGDLRGKPVLVSMFYTSCRYICPLIIDSARGVEQALTDEERQGLRIVLVSLDPDRDDPAALKRIADRRKLDTTRWSLARTEAPSVRRLAAALGIRYRALADGEFNHTSQMVLLDREGRPLAQGEASGPIPTDAMLQAARAALRTHAAEDGGVANRSGD